MSLKRTLILLAAIAVSCGPSGGSRYSRKHAQESLCKLETPGTVMGEFRRTKVTDAVLDELVGLKALEELAIDRTAITAAGKIRLQKILPRLR